MLSPRGLSKHLEAAVVYAKGPEWYTLLKERSIAVKPVGPGVIFFPHYPHPKKDRCASMKSKSRTDLLSCPAFAHAEIAALPGSKRCRGCGHVSLSLLTQCQQGPLSAKGHMNKFGTVPAAMASAACHSLHFSSALTSTIEEHPKSRSRLLVKQDRIGVSLA